MSMYSNSSIFFINFEGKWINSPREANMVTWDLEADEIGGDELIWVMAEEFPPICDNPNVENVKSWPGLRLMGVLIVLNNLD